MPPGAHSLWVKWWGAALWRGLGAPRLRVRWVVLRLLGLTLVIASASLWTQVIALSGAHGVVPFAEVLERSARHFGVARRIWEVPTLCWLWDGDGMLHLLCAGGVVAGVLCVLNLAPRAALVVGAVSYLSLASVCEPWLGFQWDALLIETLVLGALLAPRGVRPGLGARQPPGRAVVFLLLFAVFRLHFESGVVKLTSGDAVWRELRALEFHYETQPLPSFVSAWVHGLPVWLHRLCCAVMFVIEIGAPVVLLLAPWRRVRLAAVVAMLGLQVMIAVTGNFAFFNVLTVVVLLLGLDDGVVVRLRSPTSTSTPTQTPTTEGKGWGWRERALAAWVVLVVCVGGMQMGVAVWPRGTPRAVRGVLRLVGPTMVVNSYGLFRWMTTTRDEIVLEGSDDGQRWLAYELPAKPGQPRRAPPLVAPGQPRLDWQLWFAALGQCQDGRNDWVLALQRRMLEHRRPVLALFSRVPFPNRPPRYLRTQRYRYHFTTSAQREATGAWWRRELLGPYCPTVTLVGGRLVAVD